jgi:hypothetical protein
MFSRIYKLQNNRIVHIVGIALICGLYGFEMQFVSQKSLNIDRLSRYPIMKVSSLISLTGHFNVAREITNQILKLPIQFLTRNKKEMESRHRIVSKLIRLGSGDILFIIPPIMEFNFLWNCTAE